MARTNRPVRPSKHKPKVVAPKRSARKRRKIVLTKAAKNPALIEIDDVLRKVNYVQTERVEVTFEVEENDMAVVANILKDVGVVFTKTEAAGVAKFVVSPGPERIEGSHALDDLEDIDDEILEDGQIFQ